ncbi:hypothetical protein DES53_11869 [Roseimicrobium gellanilyticum]|uniref:Uncharacterized protein n=1 Tax=Roseimicrobium gellanilyticum TaxID=748857 RepID=A0A366H3I9_9BACT|nr:hypothetical protein [Roseimicrobium gellanilyticum]RBP36119.1 hypothetical protein DES53_11869 [Roseimicrobium gellanilyticum]
MKKLIVLLSAIGAFSFIPLTTAQAGGNHYRLTGYTPCGQPIYAYFHVHGYNHCGQPVGHWVTQYPSSCGCNSSHTCKPVHIHDGHAHSSGHHHHKGGQVIIQSSGSGWGFQVVK